MHLCAYAWACAHAGAFSYFAHRMNTIVALATCPSQWLPKPREGSEIHPYLIASIMLDTLPGYLPLGILLKPGYLPLGVPLRPGYLPQGVLLALCTQFQGL